MADWKQKKSVIIFFRIILILCLLEIGLRASGNLKLWLDNQDIPPSDEQNNTFNILVLGDSISYGNSSWPSQLESLLNKNSTASLFKVYNKAIPSSTSSDVVATAEYYLTRYKPKMVFVMMGALDPKGISTEESFSPKYLRKQEVLSFFKQLKIYQLGLTLLHSLKKTEAFSRFSIQETLRRGEEELKKENYLEAEELLLAAIEIEPKQEGYFLLGELYLKKNNTVQAEKMFREVLSIDKKNFTARAELGKIYRVQNRTSDAIAILTEATEIEPKNIEASFELMLIYLEAGNVKEIERLRQNFGFSGLISNSEEAVVSLVKASEAAYGKKDDLEAEKTAKKAVIANPFDERGHLALSAFYLLSGFNDQHKFLKAKESLTQALQINPKNTNTIFLLGRVFLMMEQEEKAIPLFEEVIQRKALSKEFIAFAYYLLGDSYWKVGKKQEATTALLTALDLKKSPSVYLLLAKIYQEDGSLQKALSLLNELLNLDPTQAEAYFLRGMVFLQEDKDEEFENSLKLALSVNPAFEKGYVELAWFYLLHNQTEEAEELFYALRNKDLKMQKTVYSELWKRYIDQKNYQDASELLRKMGIILADEYSPETPSPETLANYLRLHEIISSNKIPMVIVQYPTLSLNQLNQFLVGKDVIFVSNKENFQRAIQLNRYSDLFRDYEHGSFGHPTREGSFLIAEEVAKTVFNATEK